VGVPFHHGLIGNFTGIRKFLHVLRINLHQLVYVAAGGRPVGELQTRAAIDGLHGTDGCGEAATWHNERAPTGRG
jgi:hypothetical protein